MMEAGGLVTVEKTYPEARGIAWREAGGTS